MNTKSAIELCRILIVVLALGFPFLAYSFDLGSVTKCKRPPPGTVSGACEVRDQGYQLTEESPFPFIRWKACLQSEFGLPSGGYGDAVFSSDLVPEWELEINTNLLALNKILSKKDKLALEQEQEAWQLARIQASKKRANRPSPEGTMYMASAALQEEIAPQERAIELACRVEKLGAK